MFSCNFVPGARRDDTGTAGGGTGPGPDPDIGEKSRRASAGCQGSGETGDKRMNAECGGTGGGR